MIVAAGIGVALWFAGSSSGVNASANVSGTVKSPGGTGVGGVEICFNGPSGECRTTSSDGTYMVTLMPGRYHMSTRVGAANYGPAIEQDIDVVDSTWPVLDVTLTELQMWGNLKKSDGTAVQGWVNVHDSNWTVNKHADSDQNGRYSIGGLQPGAYIAETGLFNNVSGVIAPAPQNVTIDAVVKEVNFVYTPAAKTLSGVVTKSNGTAVTTACVNANKMNGGNNASAHVDGSGAYSLSLTGGSWMLNVNPCEPNADWIPGNSMQVDFADDTTIEAKTQNFTVTVANASVSGTVRDTSGALVTTGNIDIKNASGIGANTQVQSNGTYRVNLSAGTYEVRYWSQSGAYNLPQMNVTVGENEAKMLDLTLTAKTAHIKGSVTTRSGAAATNVQLNAWEQVMNGGNSSKWGNARTAADGSYDMLVSAGTYGMNVSMEPNSPYVPVGQQVTVSVPSDSSVITDINFTVDVADATITGAVTLNGQPMTNMNGCVYARAAGAQNENCGPMDQRTGTFTIRVSSTTASSYQIGCHTPPNAPYSCGSPVTIAVTNGATITQNVELLQNNSTIGGRLFDSSGFPVGATVCSKLQGAMVFADREGAHYQGTIGADCSYRIPLVAGVYNIGAYFPPDSGAMNPPPGTPVQVYSGQTVEKNIQFTAADASVTVRLLDENGNGTQGYINLDNSEEINQSRQGGPGQGDTAKGADLGFGKKMPCDAKDTAGLLKCCGNSKNKNVCKAFAIPEGPNKCKNAWDCAQFCKKNKKECDSLLKQDTNSGPQVGEGDFKTGPGGCSSPEACQKYCSDPAHQTECAKQTPPAGAMSVRISSTGAVKKTAEGKVVVEDKDSKNGFDNAIRANGPTDFQGNARILTLSGHKYKVCAGLPPQSDSMPPKCQTVDLTTSKSATVTLQLRKADATMTGKVTIDGAPTGQCFVHAWAEDGNFSGSPCNNDGTYKLNLTCNTKWHIGADSMQDVSFYRSEESVTVVECGTKSYSKNMSLVKQDFEVPHPVTVSGTCSSTLSLGLSNGANIEVPGGALSTSTDGTCSCTASPTIDLMATQANQPEGVGYTIECRDENNAVVKTLNTSAIITLPYKIPKDKEGTSYEEALQAVFYDSTAGAYKNLDTCTKNTENDTFSCPVTHFSVYTVANASGSSANSALVSVTTSKSKANITSFTVNKKKVTPFASCKTNVTVVTNSVAGTQYIAAGSECSGTLKIYDVKGKLKKQISTGFAGIATVTFADVTNDGKADITVAPTSGTQIKVYDVSKKYKAVALTASDKAIKLTVSAIDFRGNGITSLVTGTVTNGAASNYKVFTASKGKLKAATSQYAQYLSGTNGTITLNMPSPTIKSVSGTVKSTSIKATFTIKGTNFTQDSSVLVGTVGASKVTYKSSTQLNVTIDATKLGKGKFAVKVTNPGGKVSKTKSLTVK